MKLLKYSLLEAILRVNELEYVTLQPKSTTGYVPSKFVFAKLASFLDRNHFNYLVRKYGVDMYVKSFTCRNQLMAIIFGQLGNRESLRDVVIALEAHQSKCYHLGMGRNPIAKTTFATANQNRDYRIFEDFAFFMMAQAR